jgi:hypothetical protein
MCSLLEKMLDSFVFSEGLQRSILKGLVIATYKMFDEQLATILSPLELITLLGR